MCRTLVSRAAARTLPPVAATICLFVAAERTPAAGAPSAAPALYAADSEHLWNRLHASLFVRVGPDGVRYGQDRLEPLLWLQSKHLLEPQSHQRAIAVLTEFLAQDGERLIEDPLKRALLQRDLWLVFNWLEGEHHGYEAPPLDADAARAAQERLRRPLAEVIRRVALTPEQIAKLPDNYEAAAAAGAFASHFEPAAPDKPYLPANLFDPTGPWVCVGRTDGATAPQHLRSENPYTNSVFLVYLRLPADRAATVDYLTRLLAFDQPLLIPNRRSPGPQNLFVPHPELPQFTSGAQLALVRRAMLIDSSHRLAASPLTESVQLRLIHAEPPALTQQVLDDAAGSSPEGMRRASQWQAFQEAQLSRHRLLSGQAGGLRALGFGERDFKTGFNAHMWDEFERPLAAEQTFERQSRRFTNREQCFFCHSMPGLYSFNSFSLDFRFAMRRADGDQLRPLPLAPATAAEVAAAAIRWKERQPNWQALHGLLMKPAEARQK